LPESIDYTLTLSTTQSATGFFKALPDSKPDWDDTLAHLCQRPMDDFLHRYALELLAAMSTETIADHMKQALKTNDPILMALTCEAIILSRGLVKAEQYVSRETMAGLDDHTPLIVIRAALEPNRHLHTQWITAFRDNIGLHRSLPRLETIGLPPLCAGDCAMEPRPQIDISSIAAELKSNVGEPVSFSLEKTTATAIKCLKAAGIEFGEEMRHESSLSPFALLRQWQFATRTDNNRNRFTLSGGQTSYGKGLTLEAARVSLMMEIVERCSSFATITDNAVQGYSRNYPLVHGSYKNLLSRGMTAIDPALLSPEACYGNKPLYWIEGTTRDNGTDAPIMIPVQSLFLFVNLDEINLYSGLGSTGLASGNTLAQAKVSALLEVIERHQEATVPFHPSTCFHLVSRQDSLAKLLESYQALGIHIQFQDITPASGIPCCKCFVRGTDGIIHKGTSANLNARQAIISAMTETPYPFPSGPPSALAMENLLHVDHETLPDFSTKNPETDLALLERVLEASGYKLCYVDLTRKDIGIPVVKAIIPGMDVSGDFSEFSRVHPDLFFNYTTLNQSLETEAQRNRHHEP
jgi:ribosomal protein S12 methylthiotransferase accessory factor YcaO